MNIKR